MVSIGYFETRVDWRTLKSDNSRWTSRSVSLKVEKVVEIGRFFRLKCFVGEREYYMYWMRWSILRQCKDLRMGEIWLKRGVLETARAAEFRICWRRSSWQRLSEEVWERAWNEWETWRRFEQWNSRECSGYDEGHEWIECMILTVRHGWDMHVFDRIWKTLCR